MNKRSLLEMGYPHLDYCEIADDKVVRRVQVWEDGRAAKQTIEGASKLRARIGLRETVPELGWNQSHEEFVVEEVGPDEFERAWTNAALVDAEN